MASRRRLPSIEVLREHVRAGKTNKEIGDLYGVSGEAVRQELKRHGITQPRQRVSHRRYVPWRIRNDHYKDILAKRLRLYSRALQGFPLTEDDERQLAEWRVYMDGGNRWGVPLSIHYTLQDGFWLEPRRPGDEHYISANGAERKKVR